MKKIDINNLKVAIVHDLFMEYGGAERVVEAIHDIFPQADVYTCLVNKKRMKIHWHRFRDWKFHISWFGKLLLLRSYPSAFRFLIPFIWESFDLSGYDLVISSSGWMMSKGVLTRPETLHISYIHHQNKFLTYYESPDQWRQNFFKKLYGYFIGVGLRMWDFIGTSRPDILLTNSRETAKRINKYYRKSAQVLYPPVKDPKIKLAQKLKETKDYYITVNRLSRPKHIEILIKAANILGITLYVVGDGPQFSELKAMAKKNIIFCHEVSEIELSRLYLGAKAFLFASKDEEFGIAPVEAMMRGIPVICYKSGGLKETVKDGVTGLLVEKLEVDDFVKAILKFEKQDYSKYAHSSYIEAKKYTTDVFQKKLVAIVLKNLFQ